MKLDLHLKLGEMDDFYGLIERYYRTSDALCLRYAKQLLADGEKAKALEVAEEGVAIFEAHSYQGVTRFPERDLQRF